MSSRPFRLAGLAVIATLAATPVLGMEQGRARPDGGRAEAAVYVQGRGQTSAQAAAACAAAGGVVSHADTRASPTVGPSRPTLVCTVAAGGRTPDGMERKHKLTGHVSVLN